MLCGVPVSHVDLSIAGREAENASSSEHEVFLFFIQNQPKSLVVTRSPRLPSLGVLGFGGVLGFAAFGGDGTRFTQVSAPMSNTYKYSRSSWTRRLTKI